MPDGARRRPIRPICIVKVFAQIDQSKEPWSDLVDDVDKTPLDAKTAEFLKAHEPTIKLLRQAATMPAARWNDPKGDIAPVLMSLNTARYTANMLQLQSRFDQHDHPAQSVDDLLAAIALARNVGRENSMVSRLVEIGIEFGAIDRLAAMMPSLLKDVIASLPAKLAALPTPGTGKELMDAEFEYGKSESVKQNTPPEIFEAAKPFYQHVGDAMTQPPEQFAQTVDAEALKLMLNPFVKSIVPAIKPIQPILFAMDVKRAMLNTAVAVSVNGADAVKDSKDPAGEGPFEYATTPKGFVLKSKATMQDKPVELYVGGK